MDGYEEVARAIGGKAWHTMQADDKTHTDPS